MDAWNGGKLDSLFAFSLGGDFVGDDQALQIFWQTHEIASDNTVRISGANLNYTLIDRHEYGRRVADPSDSTGASRSASRVNGVLALRARVGVFSVTCSRETLPLSAVVAARSPWRIRTRIPHLRIRGHEASRRGWTNNAPETPQA